MSTTRCEWRTQRCAPGSFRDLLVGEPSDEGGEHVEVVGIGDAHGDQLLPAEFVELDRQRVRGLRRFEARDRPVEQQLVARDVLGRRRRAASGSGRDCPVGVRVRTSPCTARPSAGCPSRTSRRTGRPSTRSTRRRTAAEAPPCRRDPATRCRRGRRGAPASTPRRGSAPASRRVARPDDRSPIDFLSVIDIRVNQPCR